VSGINVLVATAIPHFCVNTIAESVDARLDMTLVNGRWVDLDEVDDILESFPDSVRCALVIVGQTSRSNELAAKWLLQRKGLVVMYVDIVDEMVRFGLRDPNPVPLLNAVRELVESVDTESEERVARIRLSLVGPAPEDTGDESSVTEKCPEDLPEIEEPPVQEPPSQIVDPELLRASVKWLHSRLLQAVERKGEDEKDNSDSRPDADSDNHASVEEELDRALANSANSREPLAVAARTFDLGPIEFRIMLLGLAPELDLTFQQCMAFLLEDRSPRVGTMGLYCSLLGISPEDHAGLIDHGSLARWLVFEGFATRPAAADEPLRLDPFLAKWLVANGATLEEDPRVRRLLRLEPWPGASLLTSEADIKRAVELIHSLNHSKEEDWVMLDGDDSAGWKALIELGARRSQPPRPVPIRVEAARLMNVDVLEIEDAARRIGRMARLTRHPLIIDMTGAENGDGEADWLRTFFGSLRTTGCRPAVICSDKAGLARLLGTVAYEFKKEPALPMASRTAAMRAAAKLAGAFVTTEAATALVTRYPLQIDALEQAAALASSLPSGGSWASNATYERFTGALKELAAVGVSHLVDRIDPIFTLEQIVLPPDRKQQLYEIVDHVRLADRVLDEWKFREQLPYGRGVAALFFGSSGTGKTMAAMGIARQLGVQILRLDLARVISKYIGDTEKNLDRVFTDAQRSGAAILIDEADALFGKRSEVKDAHDRYANIEVAYLLQRMEAYEGIAILTTNLRKNIDPAFMRRLRFVVDFPRPDAASREKIWRQCLPEQSHQVTDAGFNQLARRLDLTGGQIRQTTLRAAFLAAAAGQKINLEHIAAAARAEMAKQGIPPVELDLTQIRRAA
jgi:hypothetical protein